MRNIPLAIKPAYTEIVTRNPMDDENRSLHVREDRARIKSAACYDDGSI